MRIPIKESEIFRLKAEEETMNARRRHWVNYWQECDRYLRSREGSLELLESPPSRFAPFRYSTNQLEFSLFIQPKYYHKLDDWHGQEVFLKAVCLHGERLFDTLWYPNRDWIDEQCGFKLRWVPGPPHLIRMIRKGPDVEDKQDWPDQFAWFHQSAHALGRALFGEISFKQFILNQMGGRERTEPADT